MISTNTGLKLFKITDDISETQVNAGTIISPLDFNNFKIPKNIYLTSINYDTGMKSLAGDKKVIVEALKRKDINNFDNNNLISIGDRDTLVKFRQFY